MAQTQGQQGPMRAVVRRYRGAEGVFVDELACGHYKAATIQMSADAQHPVLLQASRQKARCEQCGYAEMVRTGQLEEIPSAS